MVVSGLAQYCAAEGIRFARPLRIVTAGAPPPPAVIRAAEETGAEITHVYGTTLKAIIHEMFGDGIMSAIDFELEVLKKPDPKGDRVVIVMNGKFLPYRKW